MDFVTLGMFIIDDIYPPPSAANQQPHLGVPGGAGTYSALGARILSPPPSSRGVGWVVDCGPDFPEDLRQSIEAWQTGALMRERQSPTTRGWNGYSDNEKRDFKYLTPKIRIAEDDLSPDLLASKSFHMVCAPSRAVELVKGITARRKDHHPRIQKPLFIYEPNPDWAIPDALEETLSTIQHVDVLSPNHSELANLFGRQDEVHEGGFKASVVEECAEQMLKYASDRRRTLNVIGLRIWLPPYHTDQRKVVDPTGGGNGFLGGFAVGLVRTGDIVQATAWGMVSASFCIEQVGVPVLHDEGAGLETWNGVNAQNRLSEWKDRISMS
ncbi:hypothetical protein CAC42_4784 [Sphaceloma murrayae]|uniref:Carbohydrate kinase PfkB domain-containing protein n=1 Tax=Sphaceloma murrayae TaxID=2082308 RepID=A0A2K1QPI1_9PEZI|nr:hypothetical protein CAC42_4784 [Sphaceloma murrayae]